MGHQYTPGIAVGHAKGESEPQVYYTIEHNNPGLPSSDNIAIESESGVTQATWTGAGDPHGSLAGPLKLAVDNSESLSDWAAGDVYVSDPSGGIDSVYVFHREPNGEERYVTELPVHSNVAEPRGIAVDESNGDVFAAYYEGELDSSASMVVDEFKPEMFGQYALVRQLTGTSARHFGNIEAVAVDGGVGGSGDVYVAENGVIDQFSSEGVYLGQLTGTPSEPFGFTRGVAVDPASHNLYVQDSKSNGNVDVVDIFGPTIVVPDVTTSPVSNLGLRKATLEGTVNPDEAGAATCQFEWGTSESFGQIAPCAEAVANGPSAVAVHAEVTGLQPDTTYYYRLQASDGNGTNPGEGSQDHSFTTLGPPVVQEPSASGVTSTSATLNAEINPNKSSTSYYFEYGTSASYGSSVPSPPGVNLGSGEGAVGVSVHLQGLAPGTTYHYRVIAVNEPEGERFIAESPDETFTTQGAGTEGGLPDGRRWEMVTPPNKHGAGLYGVGDREGADVQAAAEGGAITYPATAPLVNNGAGSRAPEEEQMFSTRGAPGDWTTADIMTPHNEGATAKVRVGHLDSYDLFSSDLSLGIVEPVGDTPLPPLPAGSEKTLYFREASGAYKALVTSANVPPGTEFGGDEDLEGAVQFVSASPDLSHVVVQSKVALEEGAPSTGGLYEWTAGKLTLYGLDALPVSEGGGTVDAGRVSPLANDGSYFFSDGGHLYLRDFAKGESVRVDVAQGVSEPAHADAGFLYASSDASQVLFSDPEQLTTAIGGGIYECRIVERAGGLACELELTNLDSSDLSGNSLGYGEDLSYLYFEEADKLYVDHHNGTEWTRTPIATLTSADGHTWGASLLPNNPGIYLSQMTSRVSPNGRYLAFMSEASLTGYENRDANTGVPDQEVFLYDASTGRLVCASCDPTGARPVGVTYTFSATETLPLWDGIGEWSGTGVAANIPGWTTEALLEQPLYQSRYLSDSGRLFFNSSDALVPADVNGKVDVYEYEPAGVPAGEHACSPASASESVVYSASAGGCVGLISAGQSSEESVFLDASETGGDVFFLTTSRLSPQDYDNSYDIYDAHECSAAAPCAPPVPSTRPPCTTGDACKAAPTPQPTLFGAPSSETFSGAGNIAPSAPTAVKPKTKPARCKRGDVRRHGVCVKKRPVRSKRARKTNRRAK